MLLKGYDKNINETGNLYGEYSFGNIYESLLDESDIKTRLVPIVSNDLEKAGIQAVLDECDIMDVGTGRQAICFSLLGARSISHFDISAKHVKRFKELLKTQYVDKPITSTHADLCIAPPPKERFDFVYLNGIVHHFSNTADGLRNCAAAVKHNGRIWVYFYRSGTFKWFVCSMIRSLLNAKYIDDIFISSALIYSHGDTQNTVTSRIMDDFFVPYIHLYAPFDYIEFMKLLGFQVCGSNDIDNFSLVDHDRLHHSASLVFERVKMFDLDEIDTGRYLIPSSSINQLVPSLYKEDERPKRSLELFHDFQKKAEKGLDPLILCSVLFALHKIAAPQYYNGSELPPDYKKLNTILKTAAMRRR